MPRVAVIRTLPVKAEVVRWRHEECLQYVPFSDVIDLGGHVESAPHDRHSATETEQPIESFHDLN